MIASRFHCATPLVLTLLSSTEGTITSVPPTGLRVTTSTTFPFLSTTPDRKRFHAISARYLSLSRCAAMPSRRSIFQCPHQFLYFAFSGRLRIGSSFGTVYQLAYLR